MPLVKVSELEGAALDWAVAKCESVFDHYPGMADAKAFWAVHLMAGDLAYSTDWSQGGPIIERELSNLFKHNQLDKSKPPVWCAVINVPSEHGTMLLQYDGPAPLIAAMRCYVASKLGESIEIPEELT